MGLIDTYPEVGIRDMERAFVRSLDMKLMRKSRERKGPLFVSEAEMARSFTGLSHSDIRDIARRLERRGEIEIRPGLNHELYRFPQED